MKNIIIALFSLLIVSLISLIGIASLTFKKNKKKILIYLISFSAGALLSTSFFNLLPEALEKIQDINTIALLILIGIIISFVIEKVICWRHCHLPIEKNHTHKFAYLNIFGDLLHNFLDGISIMVAYNLSIKTGISTTTAVIFHEIPQEIGDFGILLYSGFSVKKALLYNFLTALSSFAGAGLVLLLSNVITAKYLIPIIIGNFIYIATADLIPELHKETNPKQSLLQLFFFILGAIVVR